MCETNRENTCSPTAPYVCNAEDFPVHHIKYQPEDHGRDAKNQVTDDPKMEGDIHNPFLTDCFEQKTEDEYKLDHEILFYLQSIHVLEPQIMRRFILACMESSVTEKDLLWTYHMRDFPQNGTLPQATFVEITKQQIAGNSQLTMDKDYHVLAESYKAFDGDYVRYVNMCNDLHSWRVLNKSYKEFPIQQITPPYRYPLGNHYPRPPQGDWQIRRPRRESHQLPTLTMAELKTVPELLKKTACAVLEHRKIDQLEDQFHQLEKLKSIQIHNLFVPKDTSIECGVVPHDYVKQLLLKHLPLSLTEKETETLCFYYEHPFVLHFFRYHDFFLDVRYEMGILDPNYKETPRLTRRTTILNTLKRYVHNQGLNILEPFKDFDTFGEGVLNRSQMKRALHILRIGYGQRCDISEDDMDFLLGCFCEDGIHINYRALAGELMQVFVERFEPGGRLAMVMESFELNLARGPYYPSRAPLLTKNEILTPSADEEEVLRKVINRLKMLVAERRICLEPIFKPFDPHNIRYLLAVLTVPRILQLCDMPVTPEECDAIMNKFSDTKGFRYVEFLQAIDTQSYPLRLPTYPVTIATMEQWKNKRAWFPEVTPQNVYQRYEGPDAIVEKCRRKVFTERLRVPDVFIDYDTHRRGTVTRKQFRRATAALGFKLSPIENLILENRYVYERDISHLDFTKFVADMDIVYSPKDANSNPAVTPEAYKFVKICDRIPISPGHIALVQEGFRKLVEKILELRIHIVPYFQDFDPWRRGTLSPNRFRRVINDLGLDFLTEIEWKALFSYYIHANESLFDYRKFLDDIVRVERKRQEAAVSDPRFAPVQP